MSVNAAMRAVIECNGGRWPCRAFFQESSVCDARETRRAARKAGWQVNVKASYGHRRLDYCPEHIRVVSR